MSLDLLREISTWKLESKLEDSHRYFYHTADVDALKTGAKCYVIGRKGSGKTAIAKHLAEITDHSVFSTKLSFKNFPFNDLYTHSNSSYTAPNQYITLWKYLIYSSVARMMATNEGIESSIRTKLDRIFPPDPFDVLQTAFAKLSGNLKLKVLGVELAGEAQRTEGQKPPAPLPQRVESLERIIATYLDDSKYLVIFDELDEDFNSGGGHGDGGQYRSLLTSLFKAVQDVKTTFPDGRILPVVFLRDDIYGTIKDPDKSKWTDLQIDLDWNNDEIRSLIAFRISRAIDAQFTPILNFRNAWEKVFTIRQDLNKEFNFITRRTCNRPRDYVRVMRFAADRAVTKEMSKVDLATLRNVGRDVSSSFRADMEDEIEGSLPGVGKVFDVLALMTRGQFSCDEFRVAFDREVARGRVAHGDVDRILPVLFHFSAIGNQAAPETERVFRYLNPFATFNFEETICIHPGLWASMQVDRGRKRQ